ncbi:hypothetical protein PVN32_20050 [Bacillus paralicheniformis]|uniref:Uncharacterized protein n=1 Tax=Bacillus paralicheniformis TaxID=1648923 RepID=A0AAW6KIX9_9BACI|nr:hypothetical protein [Bacillus paralicheniformis]MDE1383261.1 hypothetical protein [Bacillus paralicheniformis]MDE1454444.1 hypothetical protein [Bacillus paralicheniformis]
MIVPKFDRDRIIQYAKEIGIEVREVAPGEGGVFIQEEDGSERRVTTFDLFPEAKEIADLRCALAGLIAENERLKHTIEEAEELTADLYVRSEWQPSKSGVISMKLPDNLSADQRHIITALHGLLMSELKEGER